MPDTVSILLPLLELLADGQPHRAIDLERELQKTLPLKMTCGTEKVLLDLADEGALKEGEHWNVFTITKAGKERLDQERMAAQRAAQEMQIERERPKQKAFF